MENQTDGGSRQLCFLTFPAQLSTGTLLWQSKRGGGKERMQRQQNCIQRQENPRGEKGESPGGLKRAPEFLEAQKGV
ncbi:hypothetical protein EUGRSUZ_F00327 [Eucalyptus grandis]|uniref:Uncharacterized protein n=2 Tax=Eucalyptus grandis TaxID=71139 RepID=A0ACC3KB01_EUCGR|nr:hypothetical protein EUGRSUZ_F00327 [Eucalyptus grandis]